MLLRLSIRASCPISLYHEWSSTPRYYFRITCLNSTSAGLASSCFIYLFIYLFINLSLSHSPHAHSLTRAVSSLAQNSLAYGKADFINLQRRSESEKASTKDFAISAFASDLLSTLDILTTALKYVKTPISPENTELKSLYSGVEMTTQELLKTLAKHGVIQFDPSKNGDKFDPNTMEAMYQAPIPGKEPGTVMDCQKLGYMIKNRTLRPAQVGVVQDTK